MTTDRFEGASNASRAGRRNGSLWFTGGAETATIETPSRDGGQPLNPRCRWLIALAIVPCLFAALPAMAETPDGVAVVIGNRAYRNPHVPTVDYAQRDAESFHRYLVEIQGYRAGNIIDLRDATQADMEAALGNGRSIQGRLWQLVRPGQSDVTVFFSGHGAPGLQDREGYLLPSDADPEKPEINGFPIEVLIENLSKLGARSTTVYLDACFSGETPKGALLRSSSAISIVPKEPVVPSGLVMLTAGHSDQVASWDQHGRHGLFTEYLLDGLYGKADRPPYGNGDGKVTAREAKAYLDDVMTYAARREFGRTQNASLYGEETQVLSALPGGRPMVRVDVADPEPPPVVRLIETPPPPKVAATPAAKKPPAAPGPEQEALFWSTIKDSRKAADFNAYLKRFPNGLFVDLARNRIEDLAKPAETAASPAGYEVAVPPKPVAAPAAPAAALAIVPPPPRPAGEVFFATEQTARQTCSGDVVVWVNTATGTYHYPGRRWYGRTKDGTYMCEGSRWVANVHPAGNHQ